MTRLQPLTVPDLGEAEEILAQYNVGFRANSLMTMARNPHLLQAMLNVAFAIRDHSDITPEMKGLLQIIVSRAAGCRYCWAHGSTNTLWFGGSKERVDAVWDFESSDLFTPAERAALRVAAAAGVTPNAVTDADMAELAKHYTEKQIVDIVAVIALFGFWNRWNDTMATTLEPEPLALSKELLSAGGWRPPGR